MARTIIVCVLLALGVGVMWISAFGMWRMRSVFDRLHYLGPAATIGPLLFGVAMVIQEWHKAAAFKGLGAMILLGVLSPLITHAVALAARTRTFGSFTITADEEPKT